MGFYEIPPKQFVHPRLEGVVRVTIADTREGRALSVSIASDVARGLGWRDGDRVRVAFGRDDAKGGDGGLVQITRMRASAKPDKPNAASMGWAGGLMLRASSRVHGTLKIHTTRVSDEFCAAPARAAYDAPFEIAEDRLSLIVTFAAPAERRAAAE